MGRWVSASMVIAALGCSAPSEPSYGYAYNVRDKTFPGDGADAASAPSTCTPASYVDGGTCAVSWSKQIYPLVSGVWACTGCHAGTAPTFPSGVEATYNAFRDTVRAPKVGGLLYINPCSQDPQQSSFVGNLEGAGSAIMPPAAPATKDQIALVRTWVACGAPMN